MAKKFKELLRDYRDGRISRRDFMRQAAAITGSLIAVDSLLEQLAHSSAYAAEVEASDPAVQGRDVDYRGKTGAVFGYLASPSAPGKYPALIIIHANQGLNDYTQDVARRLAKQGCVALAVDYLSRHGGTKKTNPKGEGRAEIRELAPWQAVA